MTRCSSAPVKELYEEVDAVRSPAPLTPDAALEPMILQGSREVQQCSSADERGCVTAIRVRPRASSVSGGTARPRTARPARFHAQNLLSVFRRGGPTGPSATIDTCRATTPAATATPTGAATLRRSSPSTASVSGATRVRAPAATATSAAALGSATPLRAGSSSSTVRRTHPPGPRASGPARTTGTAPTSTAPRTSLLPRDPPLRKRVLRRRQWHPLVRAPAIRCAVWSGARGIAGPAHHPRV